MSALLVFRLVPLGDLKAHEEVEPEKVREIAEEIRKRRVVADPIWVAEGSGVILNGHHRVAALRRLGAARAPAWLVSYHSPLVRLERWTAGPPIPKEEVERRAAEGELFPPQTTRHRLEVRVPKRRTPLQELLEAPAQHPTPHRRPSRPAGAGPSDAS